MENVPKHLYLKINFDEVIAASLKTVIFYKNLMVFWFFSYFHWKTVSKYHLGIMLWRLMTYTLRSEVVYTELRYSKYLEWGVLNKISWIWYFFMKLWPLTTCIYTVYTFADVISTMSTINLLLNIYPVVATEFKNRYN